MYEYIEQIEKIRSEKKEILESVYKSNNPDIVYENQKKLHSMSVNISTDVADVVLPALQKDGFSAMVWLKASLELGQLSFISIPTKEEIHEKYKECLEKPVVLNVKGPTPKPGTKIKVKKLSLPKFLILLAMQGFAVPILLNVFGLKKWVWVNIINAACMVIEIVKYFDLFPKRFKKPGNNPVEKMIPDKEKEIPASDFENMYRRAIDDARNKNLQKFNDWFDNLIKVMEEKIAKE